MEQVGTASVLKEIELFQGFDGNTLSKPWKRLDEHAREEILHAHFGVDGEKFCSECDQMSYGPPDDYLCFRCREERDASV